MNCKLKENSNIDGLAVLNIGSEMRRKFTSSALREVPFQLLPHAVYSPEQQEKLLSWQAEFADSLEERPGFTVVLYSSNPEIDYLEAQLEALSLQSYQNFQVLILSKSKVDSVREVFERYGFNGTVFAQENCGYGEAMAEVLANARQDYIVMVEPQALLHPQALFIVAKQVMRKRVDLLYSSEVVLSYDRRISKYFYRQSELQKYSFYSKELFPGTLFVRSDLAKSLSCKALFSTLTEDNINWFLAVELLGQKSNSVRIPLALLAVPETANSSRACAQPSESNLKIIEYIAEVQGLILDSSSYAQQSKDSLRVSPKDLGGLVKIVVPFKDRADLMQSFLQSVLNQDCLSDIRVVLVDNNSSVEELRKINSFVQGSKLKDNLKIVSDKGYFNFARLNNCGVRSEWLTPFLLFVNNDVELVGENTISELRRWASIRDIGAVGGQLRYPCNSTEIKLQSAGINFASVRPMNVTLEETAAYSLREVDALSLAMLMTRREVFEEVHGLDELICPNGYGDAVFSQMLRDRGFSILYTPYAKAVHHESVSRGRVPEDLELWEMTDAGVPIADLYADIYAARQPHLVKLGGVANEPLKRLGRKLFASPKLMKVANQVSSVLLKANSTLKPGKKL